MKIQYEHVINTLASKGVDPQTIAHFLHLPIEAVDEILNDPLRACYVLPSLTAAEREHVQKHWRT